MSDVQWFRKKPVVIEAMQWLGRHEDRAPMRAFLNGGRTGGSLILDGPDGLQIPTLEGQMYASVGDWIIKGVEGEFYPCKPSIFEATYEPVDRS